VSGQVLSRFSFGLPLVARELIQMSSRRRTYWLRVVYVLSLYATAGFIYFDRVGWGIGDSTKGLLGTGGRLLNAVAEVQIIGIWILLPAMVAPALALEKERQTLPLLFLTRLGPITLLLEKLVSRLVPMFSLLLLSLPLLMVAYALGGISTTHLINTVWLLLLTLLQIGCLALCCSACCRTTVSAFITGYLVTAAYLIGIPFVILVADELTRPFRLDILGQLLASTGLVANRRDGIFGLTITLYL